MANTTVSDAPICLPWVPIISYADMTGDRYDPATYGIFVKVGRLVTVSFYLRLLSKGTGINSPVSILGLPYPAAGVGFGAMRWSGMHTRVVWMGVMTNAGAPALLVHQMTGPGTEWALTNSDDILDTTEWVGTVSYFAP